jgi:hypothetical protein
MRKQQESEAVSNAEVNNGGTIPPLPMVIKHRDNFVFFTMPDIVQSIMMAARYKA